LGKCTFSSVLTVCLLAIFNHLFYLNQDNIDAVNEENKLLYTTPKYVPIQDLFSKWQGGNIFIYFVSHLCFRIFCHLKDAEAAAVVTNFEDADKAETEAKAKKASNVGHEGRSSDGFILFNNGKVGVLDKML
jgi:hypothetical protein